MLTYKKLDVYRRAIELLALNAAVLDDLSKTKGNGVLADQLKRAGFSIPLNIAEGAGKSTPADQSRHYVIARGSAMECGAVFDVALVLNLVTKETRPLAKSSSPASSRCSPKCATSASSVIVIGERRGGRDRGRGRNRETWPWP